jgi:hypothetical protein
MVIPKKVVDLCQSGVSVSARLRADPTLAPHQAAKEIFKHDIEELKVSRHVDVSHEEESDLEQAHHCGNWGTATPSRLFLRVRWFLRRPSVLIRVG